MGDKYLLPTLLLISYLTLAVIASDADLTKDVTKDTTIDASKLSLVKSDLETAATGIGGVGYGQGGGFGGGYSQGGGFGGGHGEANGFGGGKQVGTGGDFSSRYGGDTSNVKGFGKTYQNANKADFGHKGQEGYLAKNGLDKANAGHVNNALKKGNFGTVGGFAKTAKNDDVLYGNNNFAVNAAKGHKFGTKGNHKKGHATKGFRNQVHKDEFVKTQTFHDENNVDDFFNKFGDEGAFKNDVKGDRFFKGNHANVFNKNHQNNAGHFLNGHNKAANKGLSSVYGQKAHHNNADKYATQGGKNFANGFNKGSHHDNSYGGNFGTGFGKKNGGFGDQGYQSGYGGGAGHGGGGYNGGGGFGFGR